MHAFNWSNPLRGFTVSRMSRNNVWLPCATMVFSWRHHRQSSHVNIVSLAVFVHVSPIKSSIRIVWDGIIVHLATGHGINAKDSCVGSWISLGLKFSRISRTNSRAISPIWIPPPRFFCYVISFLSLKCRLVSHIRLDHLNIFLSWNLNTVMNACKKTAEIGICLFNPHRTVPNNSG